MRVLVTRPMVQARPAVQALRAQGVDAQALPLIAIAPAAGHDAEAMATAWRDLQAFALVMFVSANAVEHFFAARPGGTGFPAWPQGVLAASTGPGTTAALVAAGVPQAQLVEPDPHGERFDSEALWQRLRGRCWSGQRVLIVRGDGGRDWLADTLRAAGAEVGFACAYRRSEPVLDEGQRVVLEGALAAPAQHLWWLSSSEALCHLRSLAPGADWHAAQALATHPRIAEAAQAAGFGHVSVVGPGVEAVVAWLRRHADRDNP